MGNKKALIEKEKEVVLTRIVNLDNLLTYWVKELNKEGLMAQAEAIEDARNALKDAYEKFLQQDYRSSKHIVVIHALKLELEYIIKWVGQLKEEINNITDPAIFETYFDQLPLYIEVLKDTAVSKSKGEILKVLKRDGLPGMDLVEAYVREGRILEDLPDEISKSKNIEELTSYKRKIKFFASRKEDVGLSAVDFFSIGHIIMGQVFFFIFYALVADSPPLPYQAPYYGLFGPNYSLKCMEYAIILGILWEPLENILLYHLGVKFESRKDSVLNSFFDIVFVSLGAFIAYWYDGFYLHTSLILGELILFFILRAYYLKKG